MPTAEFIETVRKQLADYVALRHRLGESTFTFADALIGHRQRCLLNLVDDGDDAWAERVRAMDILAKSNGISLEFETTIRTGMDRLSERERDRTRSEIDYRRRMTELPKIGGDAE
jgi:hypothetical protein